MAKLTPIEQALNELGLTLSVTPIASGASPFEQRFLAAIIANPTGLLPAINREIRTLIIEWNGDNIFEASAAATNPELWNEAIELFQQQKARSEEDAKKASEKKKGAATTNDIAADVEPVTETPTPSAEAFDISLQVKIGTNTLTATLRPTLGLRDSLLEDPHAKELLTENIAFMLQDALLDAGQILAQSMPSNATHGEIQHAPTTTIQYATPVAPLHKVGKFAAAGGSKFRAASAKQPLRAANDEPHTIWDTIFSLKTAMIVVGVLLGGLLLTKGLERFSGNTTAQLEQNDPAMALTEKILPPDALKQNIEKQMDAISEGGTDPYSKIDTGNAQIEYMKKMGLDVGKANAGCLVGYGEQE